MLKIYEQLVSTPAKDHSLSAAEPRGKYRYITERHIQALWWEQIYSNDLLTSDGQRIVILSPGYWNSSNGPDFKKAHLLIDGKELRGDIEIHLHDQAWNSHGHSSDDAYNDVILHVSLWRSTADHTIRTAAGQEIPKTYLEEFLSIPLEKIPYIIDADAYPSKSYSSTGSCSHEIFANLPQNEIENFFASASLWRLLKKGDLLLGIDKNVNTCLIAGLARSLGFPNNSGAFQSLYYTLSQIKSLPPESYQALALGLCGYFDDEKQEKWLQSPYYQHLHSIWSKNKLTSPTIKLHSQRTRPLHHPIRRIATLSYLLADNTLGNLHKKLEQCWVDQIAICNSKKHWRYLWNSLIALLPRYTSGYWNSHYFFERDEESASIPLMGSQIYQEMLLNAVLPILFHQHRTIHEPSFYSIYKEVKAHESSKSSYLKNRFFGSETNNSLFKKAYGTQGAFQIHHDFCRHYETSCIGCPFINRFKSLKNC